MNYGMKRPCADCPFLRKGGIPLTSGRIEEISETVLGNPGGTFACHQTTGVKGGPKKVEAHCAGALIFMEKNEASTQMLRIASRLGMYDPAQLDVDAFDLVYDDTDEWLENGALPEPRRKRAR
jgi:hypothetical protein